MQTTTLKNVKHTYQCPKEWASIVDKNDPEFCTFCSQKVFDLTHKTPEEIDSLFNQNKEGVCASFYPEQLEEWNEESTANRTKFFAAAITALFAFASSKTIAQESKTEVKTEQTEYKYKVNGDSVCVKPKTVSAKTTCSSEEESTSSYTKHRRRYIKLGRRTRIYTTSKFPFIKIKRLRSMRGKFSAMDF